MDYKLGYSELHEIPLPTVLLGSEPCNSYKKLINFSHSAFDNGPTLRNAKSKLRMNQISRDDTELVLSCLRESIEYYQHYNYLKG